MTIKTSGLEELGRTLAQLGEKADAVASQSLYDGAGVVADAFQAAVSQIRTEPFRGKRDRRLPSPEEKAALVGKTGVAKFRHSGGEVDTVVGMTNAGYTQLGKRTVAVQEIARSINSGTSFMTKQPVFRRAASQSRGAAKAAIVAKADALFDEITGG